jgi:beta-glucuronidase
LTHLTMRFTLQDTIRSVPENIRIREAHVYTNRSQSLDLNGTWKFIPDPMQRGIRQRWWVTEREPHETFPCWDIEALWDIQVPGTWNSQFPGLTWYEGHGVYVREFRLPAVPEGWDAYLCFDGANYTTEAWLNGTWVGKHECGYSPFQFRVTPLLHEQNRLFVYVENERRDDRVPGLIFDWMNDGGLIRPVRLVLVPERHLDNFQVRTRLDGDLVEITVHAWFTSRDESTPTEIAVAFPDLALHAEQEVSPNQPTDIVFRVPRSRVELWEPGQPTLYRIELSCGGEVVSDEVGLREVRTDDRDILLNGQPTKLWGVCAHSEFKHLGRSDSSALLDDFFAMVRDLGVNFVRCAHYPYSEAFIRRADREGVLLWEEVPAYWQARINEPAVKALALQMMRETIDRDQNRASVIIWSVSNECEWKNPDGNDRDNYFYGIECAEMARAIDPSRLISSAEGNVHVNRSSWTPHDGDQFPKASADRRTWRPTLPDAYFRAMDIIAVNNYMGAFGQQPVEEMEDALRVWYDYNKPVLVSEFGSVSRRGDARDNLTAGGEQRHVDVVRRAYEVFGRLPWLSGASIWNLLDFRTPLHWENFAPGGGVGMFGIVDAEWRPKLVYYVVQAYCRRYLGTTSAPDETPAPREVVSVE